jgi:hypothetical protein
MSCHTLYMFFLKLGPLNKTGVVIQLADRFIVYDPKGVVKDVLVQVNEWFFLLSSMCLIWRRVIKMLLF